MGCDRFGFVRPSHGLARHIHKLRFRPSTVDLRLWAYFLDHFRRIVRDKIESRLHFDAWLDLVAFERADTLLEQLAIKIEADGGNMAALLRAKHGAGAAQLEIAHRDFETASQRGILLDGANTLARI